MLLVMIVWVVLFTLLYVISVGGDWFSGFAPNVLGWELLVDEFCLYCRF